MKTITINGINFELGKDVTASDLPTIKRQSVFDCYSRPSATKVSIWEDWFSWFIVNGGHCGVNSYNCNFFTITGIVVDKETKEEYYCYITASHNRCYRVV